MTGPDRTEPSLAAAERLLAQTAWLQALARSLVADRDVAADLAQETLLVAWKRRLCGVAELRPWLAAVARNLARRMLRGEQRRRRHEGAVAPGGDAPAAAEVVLKASLQRDVVDAALRLAEPYRSTLLLRFQEDLGYAGIAARTGVPIETVRTRIKRALRQLRAALDERHGGRARAWALPILGPTGFERALAEAAPAAATAAAGGAKAAGAGVLLMSLQAKAALVAAVVVAALAAWQLWPAAPAAPAGEGPLPPRGGALAARGEADAIDAPSAPAAPRTEVATAPPAGAPAAGAGGAWLLAGRVVDDATGAPIAGAALSLVTAHAPAAEVGRSDGDGCFAVPLREGFFELMAAHGGHAPAFAPLGEVLESIQRHRGEADAPERYELGDLRLVAGQRVSGRVLAADGRTPVAGADIQYYRASFGMVMSPFASARPVAQSGADGGFTLAGRFEPGYRLQYLYAISPRGLGWCTLQVAQQGGDSAPHAIVLRPSAAVEVEVVDAHGAPVPAASITAVPLFQPLGMAPRNGQAPQLADPPPLFTTSTDASGRGRLAALPIGDDGPQFGRGVPGGSYVLHVWAQSHRHAFAPLQLQAGGRARQRIVLAATDATLRVHGIVTDAGGRPLAGASVRLEGVADGPRTLTTAGDGRFAGDVRSQLDVMQAIATAPGHAMLRREVALGAGPELELRFELTAALPIRGRVVDQDGRPVAQAPVYLDGDVADLDHHVLADADGRFAFEDAATGRHQLLVIACPQAQVFDPVQVAVDNSTAPQDVEVRMRRVTTRLAEVEIAIVESAGGRPLEPTMAALAPVDEQGALRGTMVPLAPFVGGARARAVPPGRYLLRIETREGYRGSRPLEIAPGVAAVRETIALDAPATVAVRVDLSALPANLRPQQLQVELSPWDAGRFGDRNRKDVGDRRTAWFCVDLARGDGFDLVELAPGTPCTLTVRDDRLVGELQLSPVAGANAAATLRVRPK